MQTLLERLAICASGGSIVPNRGLVADAQAEIVRLVADLKEAHAATDIALKIAQDSADLIMRVDEWRLAAEAERDAALAQVAGIFACEGCGRVSRNPNRDLEQIHATGGMSCCPERKIVALAATATATAAEQAQTGGRP